MAHRAQAGWWQLGLWALVLMMSAMLMPRSAHIYSQWWHTRQEVRLQEAQLQSLRQEGRALRQQIQRLSMQAGKEALAREKGWLKPGEQPLQFIPESGN
jgi:cell division protein FtsB